LQAKYQAVCEKLASKWGVSPDIHPNDFIFQFLWDHPGFETKEKALEYYFDDGHNSAQKLRGLLEDICGLKDTPCHLLEFASGYGCVTRHYKNTIPFCNITACDIHPAAIQFIEEKIGTQTILSRHVPEDLKITPTYDVVFALSFFSHVSKTVFLRWLKRLATFVKPGGYLIFTTHGLISRRISGYTQLLDPDGFHFKPGAEQKDLDEQEYGVSLSAPQYVFNQIFQNPKLTPVFFQEGYWWEQQDIYVLRAESEPFKMVKPGPLMEFVYKLAYKVVRPGFKNKVRYLIRDIFHRFCC
jgi:SAM-dependent methyltransferase